MRREIFETVKIPEGVEFSLEGNVAIIKGKEGELKKKFNLSKLKVEKKNDEVIIGNKSSTKKEKRMTNTIAAHLRNMIKGVQEKFEYQLKVAQSHFPITVEIKGREATIKNFLGEKIPRKAKIPEGVEASIDNGLITIKSIDRELAGQAAANLEKATWIRLRDRRVFQDGIFIINKAGKEI
jgi:large subunit ribosomal protein L6